MKTPRWTGGAENTLQKQAVSPPWRHVSPVGWVLLMSLLSSLLLTALPAHAQVTFGVSLPGVQIGINVPVYPRLVRVPGYPVYYDPQAENNYFFYEGQYWVFRDDTWFQSSWYNGPWQAREPDHVPLFVLRVPVRYYRQPPGFFRGWRGDTAPRWGEHFGPGWQRGHNNWDRWDRRNVPAPAPLPTYQRHYSGERYPQAFERQQEVREQHDRPQPAPQPQPRLRQPAPEHRPQGDGPPNNPGHGRGQDQGRGQERGPERGDGPGRGERPDRPDRPDKSPR